MQIKLHIKKIPPGGSHILVDGKIEGHKMQFLIDTGASKSVIDKNFVDAHFPALNIKESKHSTTGLGATYLKSAFVKIPMIELGGISLNNISFGLLDLSIINAAYLEAGFKPIYLIIGGDLLMKHDALIDYRKKVLKLFLK